MRTETEAIDPKGVNVVEGGAGGVGGGEGVAPDPMGTVKMLMAKMKPRNHQ